MIREKKREENEIIINTDKLQVMIIDKKKQKQPPEAFCVKRCSQKFHKTHWKTHGPESLF